VKAYQLTNPSLPRQLALDFVKGQSPDARVQWAMCPCGDNACSRLQPRKLGIFRDGSGFELSEALEINAAFASLKALTALALTSRKVLDGLNARIDASTGFVPVFDGIAELHDALGQVEERT
jgi:hypothetical protein